MSAVRTTFSNLFFLLSVIVFQVRWSFAQTTPTAAETPSSAATSSSSYNVFSAIASAHPGGGTYGVQPGNVASDPTNQAGENAAGASGGDNGSINLSMGATIAIAVIVSVVVLLGAGTAVLFYLAKKRQWEVRATLRRSARRVTGFVKPKTPKSEKFPSKERGMVRIDPPPNLNHGVWSKDPSPVTERRQNRDVERGQAKKPAIRTSPLPQSSFDMDSPQPDESKGWSRVFVKR